MTYEDALEIIHGRQKFGSKPGLTRIAALLERMGNPQDKLKFIHITGTNGKGSTAAMLESVLRAAGYKTGLYISPYLEDFRERIQVMREMIPKEELTVLTYEVQSHIDRMEKDGAPVPTEFEMVTAIALYYFMMQRCDIVVLEVGMGGANDATNIIPACEAAVIGPITEDHTDVFGSNIWGIAREKCGIIKPCCHVVCCAAQDETALEIILSRCGELHVPLFIPDEMALEIIHTNLEGSHICYCGEPIFIPLAGTHQIQNALTVLKTVEVLRKRGWKIDTDSLLRGMKNTRWNGRLEQVRQEPLCIIDGAHNRDAMGVLCGVIDSLMTGRRLHVLAAMSEDKNYSACIPMLARRASTFVATKAPNVPKALSPEKIADLAKEHCRWVFSYKNVSEAVACAMSRAAKDDIILACGSLYMIGEAKHHLQQYPYKTP